MTRIEVEDFGPIATAAVDLKPLTVFMGPNNSGKSYLALVIYSLSRTAAVDFGLHQFGRGSGRGLDLPMDQLKRAADAIKKKWPTARATPKHPLRAGDMPPPFLELLSTASRAAGDNLSISFGEELLRCFGTDIVSQGRRGSGVEATQFRIKLSDVANGSIWEMRSSREKVLTTKWDTDILNTPMEFGGRFPPLQMIGGQPEYVEYVVHESLRELSWESGLGQLGRAYYLPASRSGILLGHKTLATLIVGRSSLAWVEPMEQIPRLPGVITDLIQALLLLGPRERSVRKIQAVVDFLEGKVTGGPVDIDQRAAYPEIFYENESGRYQFHQVSSMVSEVAPIVLFLKYLVHPNELFIIEEPESHIDAENQRNLTIAIAMLVNAGVKMLITTHSDYFVKQLNNLLQLSELAPRRRSNRGYRRNQVLDPSQVGAYLFNQTDDGTRVEALEVTASGGIPVNTFTEVHGDLYNEALRLEHAHQPK